MRDDAAGAHWQTHPERGSALRPFAEYRHLPAVQLDDLADQRQPEPESAMAPAGGRIGLPEPVEHERQEFAADPLAGVEHAQLHRIAVAAYGDRDRAARFGELHSVR